MSSASLKMGSNPSSNSSRTPLLERRSETCTARAISVLKKLTSAYVYKNPVFIEDNTLGRSHVNKADEATSLDRVLSILKP
jgi:hypothetical protein